MPPDALEYTCMDSTREFRAPHTKTTTDGESESDITIIIMLIRNLQVLLAMIINVTESEPQCICPIYNT